MKVVRADIPDILLLWPVKHGDARGFFSETYRRSVLAEHGAGVEFLQDNHSRSEVLYKVTDDCSPEHDAGLCSDDPALGAAVVRNS